MAYFAKIIDNVVVTVIAVSNSVIGEPEKSFPETDGIGQDFIKNTLCLDGEWRQTSYNHNFRKNYAGIGFIYDATKDAFIPPQPFPSWIFDLELCRWNAPKQRPTGNWIWNESSIEWMEIK